MTAATTNKQPTEQKVLAAAGVAEGATVDQVAADVGIGRTSARKYLAALEQGGTLKRVPGGRDGKRKLPDRYLVQKQARTSAVTKEGDHKDQVERLRPGGLDELVLGYMLEHDQDAPFRPRCRRQRPRPLLWRGRQLPAATGRCRKGGTRQREASALRGEAGLMSAGASWRQLRW